MGRRAAAEGCHIVHVQGIAVLGWIGHVVAGVHIAAAGDDERIHRIDDLPRQGAVRLGPAAHGREQHRCGTCGGHAVDVLHVDALEAVGLVERGGDADNH